MIVCHCNVICADRIRSAVADALDRMPADAITPAQIYSQCRCAPDCGRCQDAVRQIIDTMTDELACAV